MRGGFFFFVLAAGLAFGAGWLFGNEVQPPKYEDVNLAVYVVPLVISFLFFGMARSGR